jgi:glycerol-3-phosphate responsive antiterminator
MAAVVKNLNTRIALKYDSYENWVYHNPILLKGEIAITKLPIDKDKPNIGEPNAAGSTPAIQNAPNIVIKVGDGTNHYNDLKFVSAVAADIYSWAKAATKPTYSASEITGLKDYIGQQIQDTNTQYRIVAVDGAAYSYKLQKKDIKDADYTDVDGSVISLTNVDARLDALETAIGDNGTVQEQINAAIGGLDYGDAAVANQFVTEVKETDGVIAVKRAALVEADIPALSQSKVTGLVDALASKQDNLEFEGTYNASTNKVATASTISNAIAALDSRTAQDAASATKVVAEVTQADGIVTVQKVAVNNILPDVEDTENGFVVAVSQTDGKIAVTHKAATEVLSFAGNYNGAENPIATRDYVTSAVSDLNGAMHFIGVSTTDPLSENGPTIADVNSFKAGDVVLFGYDEYVYDGTKWVTLGNESIYAKAAEVNTEFGKVRKELTDAKTELQGEIDSDIAAAKTELTGTINDAIQGLDKSDAAVAGQFVTAVSEADGVITVSRAALKASDIPNIEQSQVNGLATALAGKQNKLEIDGTVSSTNKVATQETVSTAIAGLDSSITEETNKVISSFAIADGVIKAETVKKVTLAKVATTGKVEDIEQDGLVIINCGSATTNIATSNTAAIAIP